MQQSDLLSTDHTLKQHLFARYRDQMPDIQGCIVSAERTLQHSACTGQSRVTDSAMQHRVGQAVNQCTDLACVGRRCQASCHGQEASRILPGRRALHNGGNRSASHHPNLADLHLPEHAVHDLRRYTISLLVVPASTYAVERNPASASHSWHPQLKAVEVEVKTTPVMAGS